MSVVNEPLTYDELQEQLKDSQLIINHLAEKNKQLIAELSEKEFPERAILVLNRDAEKASEWEQVLQVLYQAAGDSRLCISEVKDDEGNIYDALCGIHTPEEGCFQPYPLFTIAPAYIQNWSYPDGAGGWVGEGEVVKATIAVNE